MPPYIARSNQVSAFKTTHWTTRLIRYSWNPRGFQWDGSCFEIWPKAVGVHTRLMRIYASRFFSYSIAHFLPSSCLFFAIHGGLGLNLILRRLKLHLRDEITVARGNNAPLPPFQNFSSDRYLFYSPIPKSFTNANFFILLFQRSINDCSLVFN